MREDFVDVPGFRRKRPWQAQNANQPTIPLDKKGKCSILFLKEIPAVLLLSGVGLLLAVFLR
jgi:hypothetical protein